MKRYLIIFGFSMLLISSCFFCRDKTFPDDDFYNDLASENNRIWGELSLDVFDDNLESLTYDFYINYLDENKMPSAEDLVERIKKADQYYFSATQETFIIMLFYEGPSVIVGDNAATTIPDTVLTWSDTEGTPDLSQIAGFIEN